ncbi:hypothetical protein [Mucilaginibacter gracilis]|uniref:hypothetical protein n=1 Tax=Mucilaginibacter gracilis TaxID=423350 RepID=UPI000EB21D41|nr:hypothetical protein [Mucilaginibacter gracilis]
MGEEAARYYYEMQIIVSFFYQCGFRSRSAVRVKKVLAWRKQLSFSCKRKGASGSWAEPYFACFLRCKKGLAYPPGILKGVFAGERKEKRILGSIPYNQIKT